MSLNSEADWNGCLEDVWQVENTKKAVTDQYLASLASKLGKGKAAPKKGRSKGKVQILDLDHAESGDDDFDEGLGGMEKESKFLEQLQNQYGHCQLCGTSKACKIAVSGAHHPLSNNKLCAWAQALSLGMHGVTLKTPPRDVKGQALFSMFFKISEVVTPFVPPVPPIQSPFGAMPLYMGMNLYGFMPWAMPGHTDPTNRPDPLPHAAQASRASTSTLAAAFPSSDPLDMGALNPYPEIHNFLHELNGYQPQRNLLGHISKFDDLDFYNLVLTASHTQSNSVCMPVNLLLTSHHANDTAHEFITYFH
ncbi:hypothetical protein B0H10DRAFT_2209028 [Mycena sp. CBHHK59/15]|nr:hypothetical protein B0H10DRAFT_2209028 [Mycena sp. CBHHK59/15]